MVHALHPDTPRDQVQDRWVRLFDKLDTLTKKHLIVCPESFIREAESVVFGPRFVEHQRMYELLSHGVRFNDAAQITGVQVVRHARDWLAEATGAPLHLEEADAIQGDPHAWVDTIQIRVHFGVTEDEIAELREVRDSGGAALDGVFDRWTSEQSRSFEDWYREELDGWAIGAWSEFMKSVNKLWAAMTDQSPRRPEDLFQSTRFAELMTTLRQIFTGNGVAEDESWAKVYEFIFSGTFDRVPRTRIKALLWAGMAHQSAHGGRRRPPGGSALNDVNAISSVLPYCDAMLIDAEMLAILNLGQVQSRIGFAPKLFTARTLDAMIAYLDEIEYSAASATLQAVEDLYGSIEPFTGLLND